MIQGPVKYIQVDYWNYWWCVYSTAKDFSPPHWVECSLTDDADGRMPFFHFDLYTAHWRTACRPRPAGRNRPHR